MQDRIRIEDCGLRTAETKAVFAEVAQDRTFLVALEEYVHRTHFLH